MEQKRQGLTCKTCNSNNMIAIRDTNEIIYPFCLDCLWERPITDTYEMIDFGIEFRKHLNRKGIDSLYTLLPKDAFISVLKYGILSRERANKEAEFNSQSLNFIYDPDSVLNFAESGIVPVSLNRYVRTHMNTENHFIRMMNKTYGDQFLLFEIDLGVLDQVGTLFTSRTLSQANSNIFMDMNDLTNGKINWIVIQNITPVLLTWDDEKKIQNLEYQRASEVLIYSHIPIEYVTRILVYNNQDLKTYRDLLRTSDIKHKMKVEKVQFD